MKNFSRRKLIVAMLLIVTIIYPLTVYYAVQAYQAWARLEDYPEEVRPYVEVPSFIQSGWGGLALIFGLAIASSWLLLGIWST